jgi:ribonuclease HI
MEIKINEAVIFTDGSSRGNPGPGGWGAVVVYNDGELKAAELGGRENHTTNNRMELTAVISALDFVSKHTKIQGLARTIQVNTDSSYVLRGATLWIHGWKKNNWKTKTKDDVLNKDLWEHFLKVRSDLKISWNLLKGHSGVAGNERCDEIATSFADGKKPKLYSGTLKEYEVDISVTTVSKPANQKSKTKSSKGKPYSYVSSVGGIVKTHATWAECEARVKGKSGALFKKSFSPQDEKQIIADWEK